MILILNYKIGVDVKFSVLMSVYEKERPEYLEQALESIYNQSVKPSEFVLVQDGRLNKALYEVIDFYKNKFENIEVKFVVVELIKNMGLGYALQEGLEQCGNEIIFRMDSDDISLQNRFKIQLEYMEENKNVSVLGGNIREFSLLDSSYRIKRMPIGYKKIYEYGKYRNPINHMTACFRKKDVLSVGGYKSFLGLEDYFLWCRMLKNGFIIENVDEVLVDARLGDFEARRGGLKYCINYVKFRILQRKIGYTNNFEFIKGTSVTLFITLLPVRLRKIIYMLLRK